MSWDFIRIKTVKAARDYRCVECMTAIPKGTLHVYTAGKCEGDMMDYRLCRRCADLAAAYCRVFDEDGDGWPMDGLEQAIREEAGVEDVDAWLAQVTAEQRARRAREDADARIRAAMERVLTDVRAERARQIGDEGWTPEHDDEQDDCQFSLAAACYCQTPAERESGTSEGTIGRDPPDLWPWSDHLWSPRDSRSDLVHAAALIVAEIERLDRIEAAK